MEYDLLEGTELRQEVKDNISFLYYNYAFSMGASDYTLLRNGLKEYYHNYLTEIWAKLGFINTDYSLLDFACGAGQYGLDYRQKNPDGMVTFMDRECELGPNIDFEADPDWHENHIRGYDIVLLSEILHCKDLPTQKQLLKSVSRVTRKWIIIVENQDPFMDFRLMKLKGTKQMSQSEVYTLMRDFKLQAVHTINYHNIFLYEV